MTTDVPNESGGQASEFNLPTYEIDPADAPIAESILGMDPLTIKGPGQIDEAIPVPDFIPLSTLPPTLQAEVERELAGIHQSKREDFEAAAVMKVLRNHALEVRSKTGLDPAAPEYWREKVTITAELRSAVQEFERITQRMTQVERYEAAEGPDGKTEAHPIFAMGPAEQLSAGRRLAELSYKIGLLANDDGTFGPEATRRLDAALVNDVAAYKAREAQIQEYREAEALADQILRDERIKARAEMLAKHRRTTL